MRYCGDVQTMNATNETKMKTYRIERNTDAYRNSESTYRLMVSVGGIPDGFVCGDFSTLKTMGETFIRTGMYYLLPYEVAR